MNKKIRQLALACISIGIIYRLIPGTPHNFTPVAAIALIGGMYLKDIRWAYVTPIVALFVSDLILNNTINRVFFTEQSGLILWADYMYWTYGAILLTVFIGLKVRNTNALTKIGAGTLLASIAFFVITNFGSWLSLPMYTKDLGGLLTCYGAAIPFFKNTITGNLVFISIFVGSIEFLRSRVGKGKSALV